MAFHIFIVQQGVFAPPRPSVHSSDDCYDRRKTIWQRPWFCDNENLLTKILVGLTLLFSAIHKVKILLLKYTTPPNLSSYGERIVIQVIGYTIRM